MLFLPCEDRDRCLRTRKQALARRHICWQLDLGLPASRTMRNRLLLLTSRPACLCYGGRNGLSRILSSEVRREPRMRACHLPRRCPPAFLLGPCTRVPVPAPNSLSHSRSGTGQGLGGEPVGPGTADLQQALHVAESTTKTQDPPWRPPTLLPIPTSLPPDQGMSAFHPLWEPGGLFRGLSPLAGTYPLGGTVPVLRDLPAFRAGARRGALGRHQGGPLVAHFLLTVRGHEREHGPAAGSTCGKEHRGPCSTSLRGEGGRGLKGRPGEALSPDTSPKTQRPPGSPVKRLL